MTALSGGLADASALWWGVGGATRPTSGSLPPVSAVAGRRARTGAAVVAHLWRGPLGTGRAATGDRVPGAAAVRHPHTALRTRPALREVLNSST